MNASLMSSSINHSNETQNKSKECSERENVLSELSNNSPHLSELFSPDDVLNEEDRLLKSAHPEFRTPPGFTQTRPSNAKVGQAQGNDKDIAHPTVQLDKDPSIHADEQTLSSRNLIHTETTSSDAKKFPRFDLDFNSSHSHDGPKDEYEVLVEIKNGNKRNYPIKSILKNGGLTSAFTNYSTDPENIPSDASSQQVTTPNATEIDLSSKMANQHDGRCGVYVSIPVAVHHKRSKKHIAQLAAMSGCGFILVSLILAWILSPTFL